MTPEEDLTLQDALSTNLFHMIGIQQALWHVREDSTEYPMCHMLAAALSNNVMAIIEAMPEDWSKELHSFLL